MKADIPRLLEFQQLLAAFNQVERHIHRTHGGKYVAENDTEHSYNLAMTAWFLAQWFPALDRDLVIRYALAHDLVEIHAGDTFIYADKSELATKQQREADALTKLRHDWADFDDMLETIKGYEAKNDPEARFVYALDKIIPIMTIYIHNGYTWDVEKVTLEMLYEAKAEKVKLSPEILPYFDDLYALLITRPDLIRRS